MNKKILLIDDDPKVTLLLAMRLRKAVDFIVVKEVNNPHQVIPIIRDDFLPDLIVCDIDMGDVSGGDVVLTLRSYPDLKTIPVILLSSLVTIKDNCENIEDVLLVSKEIGSEDIVNTILCMLP